MTAPYVIRNRQGCATCGVAFCACTGWPTTMTLTTPSGVVTMTWDAVHSWYAGCGSVSLLTLTYPDSGMAAGDPWDYDYPGSSGNILPGGSPLTSTAITVWYKIVCGLSNKLNLSCSCATLARTLTGSGQSGYLLPYPISSCLAASSTSTTGPQATNRALCATGDPPSGVANYTGSFTDTMAYAGFGAFTGSALAGTLLGVDSKPSDSARVCSPAFARWTGLTMDWGSYQPWFDQECNFSNHKRQKFGSHANTAQTTTGTYTFAP